MGVGLILYVVSCLINTDGSRTLHGTVGIVRLLGFIGIIFGVLDLVCKPRTKKADDDGSPQDR